MAAALTVDGLAKLTVVVLREQLASRGLDKKGVKAELVARLAQALLHEHGDEDPAQADGAEEAATAARPESQRTQRSAQGTAAGSPGAPDEQDDGEPLPVRRLSPAFGTLADSPVAGLVETAVVHKRGGGGVSATPWHAAASPGTEDAPTTGLGSWVRNSLDSLTKLSTAWGGYLAGSPRGQAQQAQQAQQQAQQHHGGPAAAPKLLPAAKRDLNAGAPVPVAPGVRRVGVVAPVVLSRLGWKPKTGPVDKKARNPTPRKYDAKSSIAAKGALPWGAKQAARPMAPLAVKPQPAADRRATMAPGARLAGGKPFLPGGAVKRQSIAAAGAVAARSNAVAAARKRSLL